MVIFFTFHHLIQNETFEKNIKKIHSNFPIFVKTQH